MYKVPHAVTLFAIVVLSLNEYDNGAPTVPISTFLACIDIP